MALGAGLEGHEALDLLPGLGGVGLPVAAFQVRNDAFEGFCEADAARPAVEIVRNGFRTRAVEQDLLEPIGQVREGRVDAGAVVGGQCFKELDEVDTVAFGPDRDRPLTQGQTGVGHHQVGSEFCGGPQPPALRTGPLRRVEGKTGWSEFAVADAASEADGLLAEADGPLAGDVDQCYPMPLRQSELQRIGEPVAEVILDHQAVDHDLDGMRPAGIERARRLDLDDGSIHPHPRKAVFLQPLEQLVVSAFLPTDDGRHDDHPGALRQGRHLVDHLINGAGGDGLTAAMTVGCAHARVKQAQIVVDFGDSPDRRARVVARGFLLDGDRR